MKYFWLRITLAVIALLAMSLVAVAQTPGPINVGWGPATKWSDGTPITTPVSYNVYVSVNGGPYTLSASGLTAVNVSLSSLPNGVPHCTLIAPVIAGVEYRWAPNCLTPLLVPKALTALRVSP